MPRDSREIYPGGELTPAEIQFGRAMDRYKRQQHRPFPTWREVLQVLLSLGYRQVEAPDPPPAA